MGIQVMVSVEPADGKHEVLDFILPSWLHGQAIDFARPYAEQPQILEPLEYLDWSAYEASALPYTLKSRDEILAGVAFLIEILTSHGELFRASNEQWKAEDVLRWYEKLYGEVLALESTALLHVSAC